MLLMGLGWVFIEIYLAIAGCLTIDRLSIYRMTI